MTPVGPALHRLRRAVDRSLLDVPGPVTVACSGGPDSLALAAAVAASERSAGAVIVDHGLQTGSDRAAGSAAVQCRALGLHPVIVIEVGVQPVGEGPEAAARSARYAALQRSAADNGVAAVLLGHTRDDQAETVLLGLARGSGPRSLAGMRAVRGIFRRPFLAESRASVRQALAEAGLEPWLDPQNEDPAFRRVRVRNTVLPVLERELGPGVTEALARTAELARADADALDDWAGQAGDELSAAGWPVAGLLALPTAVRSRVIRAGLIAAGSPGNDLTAGHVADVDRLLTDWRGQGPLHLPGRVDVGRRCGRLLFGGEKT